MSGCGWLVADEPQLSRDPQPATCNHMNARYAAALLFIATTAAAQTQPPAPAGRPARTFDSSGVGDTSLFSPLPVRTGNMYRTGSGAPGPRYWQQRADYDL